MDALTDTNDKYVTFKREELRQWMVRATSPEIIRDTEDFNPNVFDLALDDAVVIRRQDLFASPCLATYASMISLVAKNHSDPEVGQELLAIADYFEDQAKLAADEGYKLPTL